MATASEKAIAARVLRDAGHVTARIAELLGASERTVQRWLKDVPEVGTTRSAQERLDSLLAGQELDDLGEFRAVVAYRLAMKLDKVTASDKAQDSVAVGQIAKELHAYVNAIMDVSADDKEWLAGLFTPVVNPKND